MDSHPKSIPATRITEQVRIFSTYLVIISSFLGAFWIVDLFIHFTSAPPWFVPGLIGLQLINLALIKWKNNLVTISVHLNFLLIFVLFQGYLLINPLGFHKLMFWTGIIPLLVVIICNDNISYLWFALTFLFLVVNGLIIDAQFPRYLVDSHPRLLMFSGMAFSVATLAISSFYKKFQTEKNTLLAAQNTNLLSLQNQLQDNKTRLETYIKYVLEFSERSSIIGGNFQQAVEQVCVLIRESMGISQVSYWAYDEAGNKIICKHMYPAKERLVVIDLAIAPRYSADLRSRKIIDASDALVDPRTREFAEIYLIPNNIVSMMDIPITVDGKLFGILCCEHKHTRRTWSGEDVLFVDALANILTITVKAGQIQRMNEELKIVNDSLDKRVQERTLTLKLQNDQLSEYAYINAHLLRGPLSSILGLVNLIEKSSLQASERDLVDHLKQAGQNLDNVIRKINQLLDEGKAFDRKKISE